MAKLKRLRIAVATAAIFLTAAVAGATGFGLLHPGAPHAHVVNAADTNTGTGSGGCPGSGAGSSSSGLTVGSVVAGKAGPALSLPSCHCKYSKGTLTCSCKYGGVSFTCTCKLSGFHITCTCTVTFCFTLPPGKKARSNTTTDAADLRAKISSRHKTGHD